LDRAAQDLNQSSGDTSDEEQETTPSMKNSDYQLHRTDPSNATHIQQFSAQTYIASTEPLTTLLLHQPSDGAEVDSPQRISKLFFNNFSNYISQSQDGHLPLCFHITHQQQIVASMVAHTYRGPPPESFQFPAELALLNQYILPLLKAQRDRPPTSGQIIRIAAVAVDPAYQHRGLATLMLRTLMQCVVQHNVGVKDNSGQDSAQIISSILIETTSRRLENICSSLGFTTVAEVNYSAEHQQLFNSLQQGQQQQSKASETRLMIANVLHV